MTCHATMAVNTVGRYGRHHGLTSLPNFTGATGDCSSHSPEYDAAMGAPHQLSLDY